MKTIKLNKLRNMMMLVVVLSISFTTVMAKSPAKATKSIVEIAVSNDDFSILVEALTKAELVDALSADGPFTVFAPTNDAFKNLFKELGVDGVSDLTKDQLTPILLYHVVSGNVMAASVKSGDVPTLNKDADLMVKASSEGVMINKKSNVVTTDIAATNGVIHVIDAVLVPADKSKASKSSGGGCN
jgi:transforming growth factor-beta-induced protein